MPVHRYVGLMTAALTLGNGVASADAILLVKDRYQAATQVTTCAAPSVCQGDALADVLEVDRQFQEGAIFADSGLNTFEMMSDGLDAIEAAANIWVRPSEIGAANTFEAAAKAGSLGSGPLNYNFAGTQFDLYWEFVAAGETLSLYTALAQESSGSASLMLMDLTLNQIVVEQHLPFGGTVDARWTRLQDGHTYSLTGSLFTGTSGDPDVRLHVGATADFVPAPVPEPSTMLLFGTGLAGIIARRRRNRARGTPSQH